MPDVNDMDLMREYADSNSETAFAALVHRHINLVYSVALRYVGNSQDAQDVAQAVFVILAKKAASLRQRTNLTGWLYETARFTSNQLLRTRARQQARDQEAYMQSTLNDSETERVWQQLTPLLEAAMTRLSKKERTLVALRFFENKSAAETAALLGIQQWAAHKRTARALEKLRIYFFKHGVTSTTATIAGAMSANSVQAAPIMLAKTATAVALAKGATASVSTSTLIKGALKIMAWSNAKTAIAAGVALLLVVGTGTTLVIQHRINKVDQVAAARARAPMAVNEEVSVIRGSLFPAIVKFAEAHGDQLPASLADLKPYFSGNSTDMDDEHWQIKAQGKLTPLLSTKHVIFAEQKNVPFDGPRLVIYTDGHVERK